MAKLRRNCDKCSNKVGDWCTMQKDMEKAKEKICEGFKVVPPKPKPSFIQEKVKSSNVYHDKSRIGDDFYSYLKNGGAWSFNHKNPGRVYLS